MKKIKNFIFAMLLMCAVMLTSCEFGNPGNSGSTDTLKIDSTEMVADSTAAQKDTMIQCYAITKAGTQCERLVFPPDTYCFQHKKMYEH